VFHKHHTAHDVTLYNPKLEYDVQLVCTKLQVQSFLKYNKLHTLHHTDTILQGINRWQNVQLLHAGCHSPHSKFLTVHVYVNIPNSLWEMNEYIKKKLLIFEDELYCHVTKHLQKLWALLRSWRSALYKIPLRSMVHWTARNNGFWTQASYALMFPWYLPCHTSCTKIFTILLSSTATDCFGYQKL